MNDDIIKNVVKLQGTGPIIHQSSDGQVTCLTLEEANTKHAERIALGNAKLGHTKLLAGFLKQGYPIGKETRGFLINCLLGNVKPRRKNGLDFKSAKYLNDLVFYVRNYARQNDLTRAKTIEIAARKFNVSSGSPGDNGVQKIRDDLKRARKLGILGGPTLSISDESALRYFGET